MAIELADKWWTLALRGLAAVLFGLLTFAWPGITIAALVILFGLYAFVDGLFCLIAAFKRRGRERRWWLFLFQGLTGVAAGVITAFVPSLTALALVALVAAWAIVTGAFEIAVAIRLRKQITNEWLLVLSGVISMMFGVVLIVFPVAGAVALVWWIGAYAIVLGSMLLALGFKLRRLDRHHHDEGAIPHPA